MGTRNGRPRRRSRLQVQADDDTSALLGHLAKGLLDGRERLRLTQQQASDLAGISRPEWSNLERGKKIATLWILNRAAHAVGGRLRAYVEGTSTADQPRDAAHLRAQELLLAVSQTGGWRGMPEARLDADAQRSRWADVLLHRRQPREVEPDEYALLEVIDWFDDVGAALRGWPRRLDAVERLAIGRMSGEEAALPRVSGCWVVRATHRNRQLVSEHRRLFAAAFQGSGLAWLNALRNPTTAMPLEPALLWISVSGAKLYPARLG